MKKAKYHYLSSHPNPVIERDIQWFAQYGTPSQACYYPTIPKLRRACERRLMAAGIDLRDFAGLSSWEQEGNFPACQLFHKYGREYRPAILPK